MISQAFQSYTPRVRFLQYNSMGALGGCQPESGTTILSLLAFDQICIFTHDDEDPDFVQPDTVSYSIGPFTPGDPTPFRSTWTAWLGSDGVRIGKVGPVVPPADTTGVASALVPVIQGLKVSHAFNGDGLLSIVVQRDANFSEVFWYTSDAGATTSLVFYGQSPVLFFTGLLHHGDPNLADVALLYLKSENPTRLYVRFRSESYATEHLLMPDLGATPSRLIGASAEGDQMRLRFIDTLGRDVTLKSPSYAILIDDSTQCTISFDSGTVGAAAVRAELDPDGSKVTVSFDGGVVFSAAVELDTALPQEKANSTVSFENGEYL